MQALAQRINRTEASGIRKIFDLAATLKNPVNLSIGQPHFDVPDPVKEQAISAIQAGKNAYTPTQGGHDLREALLRGPLSNYREKEVLVTSAVSGGLVLSFMALLDPGDEILIPDPYFVMYKQLALMFDARPVFYDTYPDWRLDPGKIAAAVTPRTKAILLASPANPTGSVYNREELVAIAEILEKHDLLAISDEIYDSYCFDNPFVSLREICPARTIALGGFSKSHAMTGWRVGWAAGPENVIQAMTKLQQFSFVCAPTPFQSAAAYAIGFSMQAEMANYRAKRDRIADGLSRLGYSFVKPAGSFYIFPQTPWGSGSEFAETCIKNNLLVIPGGCFSERDTHFRIVFAAKDETIDQGLDILGKLFHPRQSS
ncbi:MAG: aminotransferase class I/II-fold pyridoxal phosphate-dependent enzyme [Planctomycetota bacterium]|jgi:aspartate aminotransferase/aminotransferase|nr:aminotransferase class I/II-fold pyridoxal phosphate-dependent enzyme [Planctomycetota bacterium]